MFENETYETILERMLSRFDDSFDKRQGSVIYDLLAPKAIELAQAYIQMDNVLNLGFAETTSGELLDRRVAEQGLVRKEAIPAAGYVIFTGEDGTLIEAETLVSTLAEEPLYFVTQDDVTIVGGTARVDVLSEFGGAEYNVGTNAVNTVLGNLAGVVAVTNPEPFNGGIDEETDEELYARYLEKVRTPPTSGNKAHYITWAKEIPGIADAKVYPLWDGPGTVKVVVANTSKRTPSQTVLDEVIAYIDEQKPVGAEVTVEGVREIPINVDVKVTIQDGMTLEVVRASVIEQIEQYLNSIAFVSNVVRYTGVGNAILDATGVIDYEELRVRGAATNVIIDSKDVPVVGTINVNLTQI